MHNHKENFQIQSQFKGLRCYEKGLMRQKSEQVHPSFKKTHFDWCNNMVPWILHFCDSTTHPKIKCIRRARTWPSSNLNFSSVAKSMFCQVQTNFRASSNPHVQSVQSSSKEKKTTSGHQKDQLLCCLSLKLPLRSSITDLCPECLRNLGPDSTRLTISLLCFGSDWKTNSQMAINHVQKINLVTNWRCEVLSVLVVVKEHFLLFGLLLCIKSDLCEKTTWRWRVRFIKEKYKPVAMTTRSHRPWILYTVPLYFGKYKPAMKKKSMERSLWHCEMGHCDYGLTWNSSPFRQLNCFLQKSNPCGKFVRFFSPQKNIFCLKSFHFTCFWMKVPWTTQSATFLNHITELNQSPWS
jgi:hypothetical protein